MVSMTRGRWWLVAAAAALAIAIQASVVALVWQHTRPRLPALATVTPTLDHVIAAVVAAVGDTAAVAVSDLVSSTSCQKTFLAKGSLFTRTANLYTDPGGENALIGRIAAALPADEHPQRGARLGGGAPPLTADLGGGIHLQVIQIEQGWLAATAQTGCRTAGHAQPTTTPAGADATTAINQLLTELGTTAAAWHTDTVTCPTGRVVTVDAVSQTATTDNLPTRLATLVPAGARQFTSRSNRLAWRDQTTSTIVAASDDGTHITVQRATTC